MTTEGHEGQAPRGRLGDRLIERGLLTGAQLAAALGEQRRVHRPIGQILVSLGFVAEADVAALLAEDLDIPFVRAHELTVDPGIALGLDAAFVREAAAFPYALEDGVLKVAMVHPGDPRREGLIRKRFPYPLEASITTEDDVLALLRDHLTATSNRVGEILSAAAAGELPVERLTRAVILDGIHRGATDVHIEPEEHVTRVRYRIDGTLCAGENLPKEVTAAVVSRIKVMSRLDISERRRPQDGSMRVTTGDREVDLRVSVMPCANGENAVLRLLDGSAGSLKLSQLGISEEHQRLLRTVADRPHGVFLVTGPTGSGKTTTLYGVLGTIDAMQRKVATVEDPIEYRMPLVRQSQVDPAIGYDFRAGLRALLRQDPDVILVGEIRDAETADMAIKAAMTGHLVFATLHTNAARGVVPRLVDLGVDRFLVEDTLIGAMGQRLVRRICRACQHEVAPTEEDVRWLGTRPDRLWRGAGCERCSGTGFRDRTAMVELFLPDAEDEAWAALDPAQDGYYPMIDDARRLVVAGVTTVDEVRRIHSSIRLDRRERAA